MLNAERTLLDRDKPVEDALRIAVVSIGSFDMQYSDYHIMRDLIVELLEHGHAVDLLKSRFSKEANVRRYRELIAKMREVR